MNKGIIILGAPASGKSTLIKELNIWYDIVNPDLLVEEKLSSCYNNPLKAAKYIYDEYLPSLMGDKRNFILDTTGANLNTLRKTIDSKQYQFKAVIVYCNPIIAFKRNFSRERRLPKQVLLDLWLKVYSQIDDYINMFGKDNIYVYETEYTEEEGTILLEYDCLVNYLEKDYKEYPSTFRKEITEYTVEQILIKEKKFNEICENVDFKWLELTKLKNFLSQNSIEIDDIKLHIKEWI